MGYLNYFRIDTNHRAWKKIWPQYTVDIKQIMRVSRAYQTYKGHCEGWFTSANKPYEVVTTCVLLRAFMLVPDACQIHSGGDWEEDWNSARSLYKRIWGVESVCPWDRGDCTGPIGGSQFRGYGDDYKVKTRMVDVLV